MNAIILVFVICVKVIIYLLFCYYIIHRSVPLNYNRQRVCQNFEFEAYQFSLPFFCFFGRCCINLVSHLPGFLTPIS